MPRAASRPLPRRSCRTLGPMRLEHLVFAICLVFASSASRAGPADEVLEVAHGTSFGMCSGYCDKQVRISGNEVTFTAKGTYSTKGEPVQIHNAQTGVTVWVDTRRQNRLDEIHGSQTLSASEGRELRQLLRETEWLDLPAQIGCPDCLDGGAQWVEFSTTSGKTKRITFEAGNPPERLKRLSGWLAVVQARFATPARPR